MTEIFLLLIGCIFMIGSFFITEKLSSSELNKIAELSEGELKKIIEREVSNAEMKIEEAIDGRVETSADKIDRALEKETNEKIMAISEYSDTVLESMNKTHNEIMFLYSMLNDKHTDMTGMAGELQRLAADIRDIEERVRVSEEPVQQIVLEQEVPVSQAMPLQEKMAREESAASSVMTDKDNHNTEILTMYKAGMSDVEIARNLGLGVGEVRLVIGLYRGDMNS